MNFLNFFPIQKIYAVKSTLNKSFDVSKKPEKISFHRALFIRSNLTKSVYKVLGKSYQNISKLHGNILKRSLRDDQLPLKQNRMDEKFKKSSKENIGIIQ